MRKVLTAAEMREVDRMATERFGIPSIDLMENAAGAVRDAVVEAVGGEVSGCRVAVICGKGNNGGDGAAVGRLLAKKGADVAVCLIGAAADTKGDARENFDAAAKLASESALRFVEASDEKGLERFFESVGAPDVAVDALLGTGLTKPVAGTYEWAVRWLNERRGGGTMVVSVDVPSGLDADRGEEIGPAVRADITVTFTAPKAANVLPPPSRLNGRLIVADIGSPMQLIDEQPSKTFVAGSSDAKAWLAASRFTDDSYKNKRGHALIVAGSENYSGAAVLCANAAIRSGVGLVTLGTPRSSKEAAMARAFPEVMVRPLAETEGGAVSRDAIEEVEGFLKNVDAIAIGSGLSAGSESTAGFVRQFVEHRKMPTLLDADDLTLISPFASLSGSEHPLIVTPHEGEFLNMLGTDDRSAVNDRVRVVREFAVKHRLILVLKGERVLIGGPDGRVVINPTGNSGLGKAGNGDTLTGLLAGFLAQAAKLELDIFETVAAAVYIAGAAGDVAEQRYGKRVMTASDVRECFAEVFSELEGGEK